MRETRHTPGPWMAAAGPSSIVGWPVVGQMGRSICNLSWLGKKPDYASDEVFAVYRAEVEANGKLIAAAPDMLDALDPFAVIASIIRPDLPDGTEIELRLNDQRIYVLDLGSLRAARKAYVQARVG